MKGYPRTRFDIVNQTQIQEITTEAVSSPTAVIMAAYTSDKGEEGWELMYGLDNFTKTKGGISFVKHGQPQLVVAEALRNGAYVFAKRMVSEDAALANVTVKARVVTVDDVSYVYFFTSSGVNMGSFEEACESGYGDFDASKVASLSTFNLGDDVVGVVPDDGQIPDSETQSNDNRTLDEVDEDNEIIGGIQARDGSQVVDIPLFTVAPLGRGASNLFFRINPEYVSSKSSSYIKYSFEVYEGTELVESILFTMNPDIIIDGVAQAMNPKIKANSGQVRVNLYEDGFYALVKSIAQTAVNGTTPIAASDLVNMDFINGLDRKGVTPIGGVVTSAQSDTDNDLWTANKPADIEKVYSLSDPAGIPLVNGTNGTMGSSPITNQAEYEKMLLATYGANMDSSLFDPVIYDLDANKIDAIFDCSYSIPVKKAITDLVDFRGDLVFLADFGTEKNNLSSILEYADNLVPSKYVAMYHNYFKILDPYTKKEITVTMPFLLISRLVKHISVGVGRPFAGIANEVTFPEIIEGSVNFLPVEIPGVDQKQMLVDKNINYISYYDGTPVMETMYTNDDEYTQLSYLHNVMAVQEIIKIIRTRCPRTRYTFLEGDDLESYIDDVEKLIKQYSTNFKSISVEYMADEKYEANNIFYAVLRVQFKNFVQEEYFKIIAIS